MSDYYENGGKFKAFDGHVLLQKERTKNVTPAGLHIPTSAAPKQDKWEVLDVGHGVERLSKGDWVVFKDSSVFLGGNVIVKDMAVFIDEKNGIVAVRKDNIVAVEYSDDPFKDL